MSVPIHPLTGEEIRLRKFSSAPFWAPHTYPNHVVALLGGTWIEACFALKVYYPDTEAQRCQSWPSCRRGRPLHPEVIQQTAWMEEVGLELGFGRLHGRRAFGGWRLRGGPGMECLGARTGCRSRAEPGVMDEGPDTESWELVGGSRESLYPPPCDIYKLRSNTCLTEEIETMQKYIMQKKKKKKSPFSPILPQKTELIIQSLVYVLLEDFLCL